MRATLPSLGLYLIGIVVAVQFFLIIHNNYLFYKSIGGGCDVTLTKYFETGYAETVTPSLMELIGEIPVDQTQPPRCDRERINMVYVKTHKTASDTITNILHRFGLRRNLTFVLPVESHFSLCFPFRLEPHCFRPLKTKQFNIMCQHVVYTPEVMSQIMPSDTVYITSVREPFARVKSLFHYFPKRFTRSYLLRGNDQLESYLADIPRVERTLKSPDNYLYRFSCVPLGFSYALNGMAFALGFHTGFHRDTVDESYNATYIREWISTISRQFIFVVVVEYFNESLVLLRRLMCWSMEDILYLKQNVRQYGTKNKTIDPSLVANFRRHNVADYALYDYFNRTLWHKIAVAGDDFWPEVRHFNGVIDSIAQFCLSANSTLVIPKSPWNDDITLRHYNCAKMGLVLINRLNTMYDSIPEKTKAKQRFVPGC